MCVYKKENHIAGRNEQFAKIISKKERKKGNFMKFPNEKKYDICACCYHDKKKKNTSGNEKKRKRLLRLLFMLCLGCFFLYRFIPIL